MALNLTGIVGEGEGGKERGGRAHSEGKKAEKSSFEKGGLQEFRRRTHTATVSKQLNSPVTISGDRLICGLYV